MTHAGVSDDSGEERVRSSFARQRFMATLGARLSSVAPDAVEISIPVNDAVAQQHGFVHAGALAAIADSACGYAALTRMPAGAAVLSIEFKINMLAPAAGERVAARGRVVRRGRTIIVCGADVFAITGSDEKLVAVMTATMMVVEGRGLSD
jgi:uncharacterized protein (TIGR00369 family)